MRCARSPRVLGVMALVVITACRAYDPRKPDTGTAPVPEPEYCEDCRPEASATYPDYDYRDFVDADNDRRGNWLPVDVPRQVTMNADVAQFPSS